MSSDCITPPPLPPEPEGVSPNSYLLCKTKQMFPPAQIPAACEVLTRHPGTVGAGAGPPPRCGGRRQSRCSERNAGAGPALPFCSRTHPTAPGKKKKSNPTQNPGGWSGRTARLPGGPSPGRAAAVPRCPHAPPRCRRAPRSATATARAAGEPTYLLLLCRAGRRGRDARGGDRRRGEKRREWGGGDAAGRGAERPRVPAASPGLTSLLLYRMPVLMVPPAALPSRSPQRAVGVCVCVCGEGRPSAAAAEGPGPPRGRPSREPAPPRARPGPAVWQPGREGGQPGLEGGPQPGGPPGPEGWPSAARTGWSTPRASPGWQTQPGPISCTGIILPLPPEPWLRTAIRGLRHYNRKHSLRSDRNATPRKRNTPL